MDASRAPAVQLLLMGAVTAVLNLLGTGWLVSQGYLGASPPSMPDAILVPREDEPVAPGH